MILDKFVNVKWNYVNKNYYINKGYEFTNYKDKFEVNIDDLSKGSRIKIRVKCDFCGKEKETDYYNYNKSINNGNKYACSSICSLDKFKKTCLEKFGTEYPQQNKEIQEKSKQTCLKNYNVENPAQSDIIKEKMKQTNLTLHGVEYALQSKDIRDKFKNTCLKNYGVENPSQSGIIKDKKIKTCIKNHNVEYSLQNVEIRNKGKITSFKKYGFEYPQQNKDIIEKTLNTCIERYGEIWINQIPHYNPNSIVYLDMISEKINLFILHALNGGEKKFQRYYADGFIEHYNIVIEWDEIQHYYKKEKDLKREQFIKENYNCKIIRINEKEFLKDIENNIEKISNEILNYINNL
jgi:hypothetical protein